MRVFWVLFGLTSLGLGMLGVVLPLLPTVPFLLLATFCFARSSDRLHKWLISHKLFGPPIREWQEKGAINSKAKKLATLSIIAVLVLSLALGVKTKVIVIQTVVLCAVMVFIWTRPNG